jgi:hypothetical protein
MVSDELRKMLAALHHGPDDIPVVAGRASSLG